MKYTKIIDLGDSTENILGFHTTKNNIYVNIESIWNNTLNEDKFIKKFSSCILHEKIHSIIRSYEVPLKYRIGEELVIFKLTNTKLTKWQKDFYKKSYR